MERVAAKRMSTKITIKVGYAETGKDLQMKDLEIEAEVFGRWAVHASFNGERGDNSVTHIPSGLRAADMMDKVTARRLAEMLSTVLDVETWDADKHTPIAIREVKRIRGWV